MLNINFTECDCLVNIYNSWERAWKLWGFMTHTSKQWVLIFSDDDIINLKCLVMHITVVSLISNTNSFKWWQSSEFCTAVSILTRTQCNESVFQGFINSFASSFEGCSCIGFWIFFHLCYQELSMVPMEKYFLLERSCSRNVRQSPIFCTRLGLTYFIEIVLKHLQHWYYLIWSYNWFFELVFKIQIFKQSVASCPIPMVMS